MSDNPTVAKLRKALAPKWKEFEKSDQDAIKEVVAEIEAVAQLLDAVEASPLGEAFSSANVKMVHTATLAEVQFTMRGYTDLEVERRVDEKLKRLAGTWETFDQYVDRRRAERGEMQPGSQPQTVPPVGTADNGQQVFTFQAQALVTGPKSQSDPTLVWKILPPTSVSPKQHSVYIYEALDEAAPHLENEGVDLGVKVLPDGTAVRHELRGWTAYYVKTDKGWPQKVVRLEKTG